MGAERTTVAGNAVFQVFWGLSTEKAAKLAVLAAAYHCDFANEISSQLGDQAVSKFVSRRSRRLPKFRGKQRLSILLRQLADTLSENFRGTIGMGRSDQKKDLNNIVRTYFSDHLVR